MVVHGEFVGAHGQAAPLFEPVDAAFGNVALAIVLLVEGGWSAAVAASPPPMGLLIRRLWDRRADAAST